MYKPTLARSLENVKEQQIRLGIQGYGGTGKTTSAMTFPNPVVINLDRGLGAFSGRSDIFEVQLYDEDFCKKVNPNHKGAHTVLDTFRIWMTKEGCKLQEDQTLVVDGNGGLQNAYHKWYSCNQVFSAKTGKVDDFAEWKLKLQFFNDVMDIFKTLKCHLVYISHESDKKDKDGGYTGKMRPILSGAFGDQIMTHFTDWVRQLAKDKPKDVTKVTPEELKRWGFETQQDYQQMCAEFDRDTIYYWQLESGDEFDGKISSLVKFPRFIPASYTSFIKYSRYGKEADTKVV